MESIRWWPVVVLALAGCTTTAVLRETSPVTVTARPPAPPPPPVEAEPARVQVEQTRIRVDEKIHFEFDSAEISPVSEGLLQEIAKVMNENPQLRLIRVEGHTDRQGTARYNQTLSQRRAEAVVARLVAYGVVRDRLEPAGFGFSRPVATNDTEEGRMENRRVEFNIVDQDDPTGGGSEGAAP